MNNEQAKAHLIKVVNDWDEFTRTHTKITEAIKTVLNQLSEKKQDKITMKSIYGETVVTINGRKFVFRNISRALNFISWWVNNHEYVNM